MSKFLVEMELTGLKLKIQGDREDAGLISRSVGQQIANLLQPVDSIVDGDDRASAPPINVTPDIGQAGSKKARKRKSVAASSGAGDSEAGAAIDFKHEPLKFGNPKQAWNTATRAIWLLYVVKEAAGIAEMSPKTIAETFNKHFRQLKPIKSFNATRDLRKMTGESPVIVQEDTTKPDRPWFLTEAGVKRAQALIAEALSPTIL